ncbi:hypothetical protein [Rhodoferax sp.]|uniref:hypothetical protein n=1 Tax=Rhodoferax sp. TaxID=50421 RepID=UPI0025F4DBA6|nr:hypothetical protein [Rhodoferax sp.]MCM2295663.1 hypothetical protein [Rhodoferax sp.]MDD3935571.1 hypothetical protein [Rhodoferax sp.]
MTTTLYSARLIGKLTAASCAALLTACASTTPVLDANFGNAVRQARTSQTLNPNASANRDPVLGIDGQAGAAAQERYQESFKAPPKTFEIINIGGTLTGD